ncbi:hypothetical protein D9756_007735 [Leucocoprinus leucothites]|uniref:AAA+ ATPase domain-containing protein n=1 Tax=Leucocoprinus leucothites TaxID=201217 RepID=A0A8H5D0Y3_9AGAR|nr:hypothetical protein D9756_007735 [Leucoagaricus leucothites]
MSTTRVTRSSVLGKRGHHQQVESSPTSSLASKSVDQLQTPDSTPLPKRPRVSMLAIDGDGNKENVPPFSPRLLTPDPSPVASRTTRALRRSGTDIISPSRARPAIRRHASTSTIASVDTASDSLFSFATPPPTPVSLPLHTRARTLLRATCNSADNEIAGRDTERGIIRDFISSFVDDSTMDTDDAPATLYISGSPGCGKTALINSVLGHLNPEANGVKIIFINCMALNDLDALWERMFEELDAARKQKSSPSKSRKGKGRAAIESLLLGVRTKCILILDELDHITPSAQALTSLFSLPAATPANIRLIGIANTHTLTSTPSSSPSLNVRTVHFAPYTSNQLFDILQTRLCPLYDVDSSSAQADPKKFLPTPTLTLLTKKIAGMTGDVRSLFEVLRGAIDIAVAPSKKSITIVTADSPAVSVTPSHVLAALKAYKPSSGKSTSSVSSGAAVSNSETVAKVKNLNLQARIVLLSTLLGSKRLEAGLTLSGSLSNASPRKPTAASLRRTTSSTTHPTLSAMDTNQLHSYYTAILTRSDAGVFDPTTRSEFGDLLNVLEGNGLVCLSPSIGSSTGPGRKPFVRSASFAGVGKNSVAGNVGSVRLVEGVWCDEILRGLGVNTTPQEGAEVDVCEEEVKAIWQREQARTARDVKVKDAVSSKGNKEDVFSDAFKL